MVDLFLFWVPIVYLATYSISSENMLPTFRAGEVVRCTRFTYGFSRYSYTWFELPIAGRIFANLPQRGDVAAFRFPKNTAVNYMGRVAGLPGDRVSIDAGVMQINDNPVGLSPIGKLGPGYETSKDAVIQLETLSNGRSYRIVSIVDGSLGDDTREWTVPEEHYFMLGDNRDNSNDSRFAVGMVPFRNFVADCNQD